MKTEKRNVKETVRVKETKSSCAGFNRIALFTGLVLLLLGGFSSTWASDRMTTKTAPIHLAGFSIHVGPGGFHLGIGGFRHGYRGTYGYGRPGKFFGQRHYFKRPRHFYRGGPRYFYGHRHYGKRHNHRGQFKGGRQFRRHRR